MKEGKTQETEEREDLREAAEDLINVFLVCSFSLV
jgi:hypothetical protein